MKIKQMHPFLRLILSAVLFVIVLMGLNSVVASVKRVQRATKLENMIHEARFAVALFYDQGRRMKDKDLRKQLREQTRDLRSASKLSPYRDAGVDFYSVNVANRSDLADLARMYKADPGKHSAAFALFRDGKLVASRAGFMSPSQIGDFIDEYLEADISKVMERKDKQLAREKEKAKIRAYERSYRYPYWGFGYGYRPWGYWGWGYRPYWGASWGWGGYRGYRGCRRCR